MECKTSTNLPYKTTTFSFKGHERYIAIIEEYDHKIFVVKFFLKNHSNSKNKYNLVTNKGSSSASKVIRTVINIILEVVKENELASIGFLGSEKFSNKNKIKEGKSNTQRFRIYKYITNNYFGLEKYLHYSNSDCSAYLIINRNNQYPAQILESAINMFKLLYPELIDLTDIKLSSVG